MSARTNVLVNKIIALQNWFHKDNFKFPFRISNIRIYRFLQLGLFYLSHFRGLIFFELGLWQEVQKSIEYYETKKNYNKSMHHGMHMSLTDKKNEICKKDGSFRCFYVFTYVSFIYL